MRVEKIIAGTPIYICETPAVKYRENWHRKLCGEIALLLNEKPEPTLLRGSHAENLDTIARTGSDQQYSGVGTLMYVVPYHSDISIYYPFGIASTCMLIYRASGLVECTGDAERMNVEYNRYEFLAHPKEALVGIIDLRDVKRKIKRLASLDKKVMRNMGWA